LSLSHPTIKGLRLTRQVLFLFVVMPASMWYPDNIQRFGKNDPRGYAD
jgi:hypothetical protein